MKLFGNLFKPAAPQPTSPKPVAIQTQPIPPALPKISAPTAAVIAQQADPSPAAQKILAANPQQTPSQYLNALQQQRMGDEMVKTMAHGMPDRDGVMWAAQSAEKVSGDLPPEDVVALHAALAWVKNPNPSTQVAAATAADGTDFCGPGAWAAQAASWAKSTSPAETDGAAVSSQRLTPDAVVGAVLLSSAIAANAQLASPKFRIPTSARRDVAGSNLEAQSGSLPQRAAAGAGLAALPTSGASALSPQTPSLAGPNLQSPSSSGPSFSASKLGGLNPASPSLQSPSLTPTNVSLPQHSGTALGLGSVTSAPNLQSPQSPIPPSSGSGRAMLDVSEPADQTPNQSVPQIASPTVPPAVAAKMFEDQYPFISLGIDIAAGKKSWA